jgi:nucleoside 2-deoxyribosyltransferase
MIVYLAHPISGLGYDEVMEYYNRIEAELRRMGYETLCPMRGKEYLRTELTFKPHGYERHPASTNHAIIERDRWMVTQSDIVLADLTGAQHVSIGCCMELAWAHDRGKHTIVVMEEENVHRHAFVIETGDLVFEILDDALFYLSRLAR